MPKLIRHICLFLCLLLPGAAYAADGSLKLTPSSNGDGTYTVSAALDSSADVCAVQFGIEYDASKLQLVSSSQKVSGGLCAVNDKQAGKLYFAWASAEDAPAGSLLTMTFKAIGEGSAEVGFAKDSDIEVYSNASSSVNVSTTGTAINISAASVPSSAPVSRPSPGAAVQPEKQQAAAASPSPSPAPSASMPASLAPASAQDSAPVFSAAPGGADAPASAGQADTALPPLPGTSSAVSSFEGSALTVTVQGDGGSSSGWLYAVIVAALLGLGALAYFFIARRR